MEIRFWGAPGGGTHFWKKNHVIVCDSWWHGAFRGAMPSAVAKKIFAASLILLFFTARKIPSAPLKLGRGNIYILMKGSTRDNCSFCAFPLRNAPLHEGILHCTEQHKGKHHIDSTVRTNVYSRHGCRLLINQCAPHRVLSVRHL